MLLRHLEGLVNAFTDSYAGYDNDELAPAIGTVQLIHGLDVCIGLADTGLHLDGQVIAISTTFQLIGRLNLVRTLNLLKMLQNELIIQFWYNSVIAPAGIILFLVEIDLVCPSAAIHHVSRCQIWLAGKDIHYSLCSIRLKFLMLVLYSHSSSSPVSSAIHS